MILSVTHIKIYMIVTLHEKAMSSRTAVKREAFLKKESASIANPQLFQSQISRLRPMHYITNIDPCTANSRLLEYVFNALNVCDFRRGESAEDDLWRESVWRTVMSMIESERAAWSDDYFVFYRSVSEKYVLYEFNTLMLLLFSEARVPRPGSLICVPSLLEANYPASIEEVIRRFTLKDINDSSPENSGVLLSVNNCLEPTYHSRVAYHVNHGVEAEPLKYFFSGYNETRAYRGTMCTFLCEFMGVSEAVAEVAVEQVMAEYKASLPPKSTDDGFVAKGHTLQICLPRAALDRFAYPSEAWGHPVSLYREIEDDDNDEARTHAFPMFDHRFFGAKKTPKGMTPVPQAEFLRSPEISELQTRILAHPNLYLRHGAVCNVFHGNPNFDQRAFRGRMLQILQPLIARAQAQHRQLLYFKFAD